MILPLIGQQCVVTWKDQQHIGEVRSAGTNRLGQYRIGVWGFGWGHAIEFKSDAVRLLRVQFDDDSRYSAYHAYQTKYTQEERAAHVVADGAADGAAKVLTSVTRTERSNSNAPQPSNTPKAATGVPRMVRRPLK
jgi:hypothetical protein